MLARYDELASGRPQATFRIDLRSDRNENLCATSVKLERVGVIMALAIPFFALCPARGH